MGQIVPFPEKHDFATFTITVGMNPVSYEKIGGWIIDYQSSTGRGRFTKEYSEQVSDSVMNFLKVFFDAAVEKNENS